MTRAHGHEDGHLVSYLIKTLRTCYPGIGNASIAEALTFELQDALSRSIKEVELPPVPGKTKNSIFERKLKRMRETTRAKKQRARKERIDFLNSLWNVQYDLDGFATSRSTAVDTAQVDWTGALSPEPLESSTQEFTVTRSPGGHPFGLPMPAESISLGEASPGLLRGLESFLDFDLLGGAPRQLTVTSPIPGLARRDRVFTSFVDFLRDFFEELTLAYPQLVGGELLRWKDVEEPSWECYKLRLLVRSTSIDRMMEIWKGASDRFEEGSSDLLKRLDRKDARRLQKFIKQTYIDTEAVR